MTPCPNSTEGGCRCPEHAPGLADYARDAVAYEAALAQLRPAVRLHVVTGGTPAPECTGTMTCSCEGCVRDRVSRSAQGAGNASPFKVRRAGEPRAALGKVA